MVLITQDVKLSKDILKLRYSNSVTRNIKDIIVLRFDQNRGRRGRIVQFKYFSDEKHVHKNRIHNDCEKGCFRICTETTDIEDSPIPVTSIPKENDIVRCDIGEIRLNKEISSGGEGVVYETNTEYVAKIYNEKSLTQLSQ